MSMKTVLKWFDDKKIVCVYTNKEAPFGRLYDTVFCIKKYRVK